MKCLVTLLIGESYKQFWREQFQKTWEIYAQKHGYDIIVIDDYIDTTEKAKTRKPHWQKCLILEDERVNRYEDVVWIDADILINHFTAPCIVTHNNRFNNNKIGVVTFNDSYFNAEKQANVLHRAMAVNPLAWARERPDITNRERYVQAGLGEDVDDLINTGVMVLKPSCHREVLRHVYDTYEENPFSAKENIPLSYHLLRENAVNHMDTRFNKIWDHTYFENYPFFRLRPYRENLEFLALCVNTAWHNAYFLHFLSGNLQGFVGLVVKDYHWIDSWKIIYNYFHGDEKVAARSPKVSSS